jgi:hypothetical protein
MCVSVSASRSPSWTSQGNSHLNYLVKTTYKLAEQKGSYTPNPTQDEYGSILDIIRYLQCLNKFRFLQSF